MSHLKSIIFFAKIQLQEGTITSKRVPYSIHPIIVAPQIYLHVVAPLFDPVIAAPRLPDSLTIPLPCPGAAIRMQNVDAVVPPTNCWESSRILAKLTLWTKRSKSMVANVKAVKAKFTKAVAKGTKKPANQNSTVEINRKNCSNNNKIGGLAVSSAPMNQRSACPWTLMPLKHGPRSRTSLDTCEVQGNMSIEKY